MKSVVYFLYVLASLFFLYCLTMPMVAVYLATVNDYSHDYRGFLWISWFTNLALGIGTTMIANELRERSLE